MGRISTKYDVHALFTVSFCHVVFVDEGTTAKNIENSIIECNPAYKYEINEAFHPKKIGPFTVKNKKLLWDILMKTKDVKEKGAEFRREQIKRLNLYDYEARVPAALSNLQRERASVLYDEINHRYEFLINDCDTVLDVKHKPNSYTVASWMKDYEGLSGHAASLYG